MAKKILLLLVSFIFLFPEVSRGAEIVFGVQEKDLGVGQQFEVGVFLNSEDESVNVVNSTIAFPADTLDFTGFYTGGSIMSFWMAKPSISSSGTVSFSGALPGGFIGNKGYLFSMLFIAKKNGEATIVSHDETIFLNDGEGTLVKVTPAPLTLTISDKISTHPFLLAADTIPPEDFTPAVVHQENLFGGKYFISFATQDKQSGVDHYEVSENSPWASLKALFGYKNQWERVESPYLLKDQTLGSTILVKAVDNSGNERIAKVSPQHAPFQNYAILIIIIVIMLLGFTLWKKSSRL